MQIAYDIPGLLAVCPQGAAHAVTIGNFDGVHLGHRSLIAKTREKAARLGIASLAVTFEPHPLRLLSGVQLPDLLTDLPRKLELLAELGIDRTLVLPFTHALAALSPEDFVKSILVDALHMKELVVGYDYALGKGRRGDYALLAELGGRWGFGVEQMPPLRVGNAIASSSLIRERLKEGYAEEARTLLGRPHSVDGEVVRGAGRGGAQLGYPTVNLKLGDVLLPKSGVYAAWAELLPAASPPERIMAVASVGTNPTFGGSCMMLEAFLLNFSTNVYGRSIRLHFMRYLREQVRFSSIDALKEGISQDVETARSFLNQPDARF